ncbi:phosphonate ABC transporter ATP-binding protein [Gulosibacter chungangensis]|uniref:Phosphonate ABC transporter ATP-binding protein n=1 Tax=Gulosibacter chungangensis TaxID=979746 RepID=A0A7J5B8P1_9MICO|nr:phosphonate ABC transporter ATP-binding protein [Gulosibacter chungangensis]KAB1641696.1 phosphonate ABC transporter ATP-binding protein [Gulosibacter chungangensis]
MEPLASAERELTGVAPEPHVRFRGATKSFGKGIHALEDVSFDITPGSFTVLLGLSGSGKSTTLRLINGLHTPTDGEVSVLGEAIGTARGHRLQDLRRQIGMVFQQFHLVNSMSALENVCTGALGELRGPRIGLMMYPKRIRERALEQLERVGLADQRFQRAENLSGGQQQRVAVARALMQKPKVLLADEPVASLDPKSAHQVMRLISGIAREDGLTVVCSLHQVELAREWGDRIIGLRGGRVVLDADAADISHEQALEIYATVSGREDAESERAL